MKKTTKIFLVFIISFSFAIINAKSLTITKLQITGGSINVRKGPGTNYASITTVGYGSTYSLVETNKIPNESGCSTGWYKFYYSGNNVGFVCGTYATTFTETINDDAYSTCKTNLKNAGFPDGYLDSLCTLQSKHSNWVFKPLVTNIDYATAVDKFTSCGDAMIQTNNSDWLDASCTVTEGSFKSANQTGVSYYLNPLNFLNESDIFQFEYLKYEPAYENDYITAITKILGNNAVYIYHNKLGNNMTTILNNVAKETNVNPVFLASRINQELGTGDTEYDLYSGIYTGYDNTYYGYYNFYNIGVSGTCVRNNGRNYCGLNYAKNSGWNTVENALRGGSSFLADSYISQGQYTAYLQRFNVVPVSANKKFIHYYMANLQAPSSEARSSFSAYQSMGMLDSTFVFYIPVYDNMGAVIHNNTDVAQDDGGTTSLSEAQISTIVTGSGYKYSNNRIKGITPGTSVATLKSSIESVAGSGSVVIQDQNGNTKSEGLIGTGYQITIITKDSKQTLKAVIKGDTSGDGQINALDLLQVQKNILGLYSLSDVNGEAGDSSSDGQINALDLLQVQKSILGLYTIVQ